MNNFMKCKGEGLKVYKMRMLQTMKIECKLNLHSRQTEKHHNLDLKQPLFKIIFIKYYLICSL